MEKLKLLTSIHSSECCIAQSSLGAQPYLSGHHRIYFDPRIFEYTLLFSLKCFSSHDPSYRMPIEIDYILVILVLAPKFSVLNSLVKTLLDI